jgi:hypothetical protein
MTTRMENDRKAGGIARVARLGGRHGRRLLRLPTPALREPALI